MKYENLVPLAGRVLLAAIFVLSGVGKLAAPEATLGYINAVGLPFPQLAYFGAIAVELVGGILLVVGYRTRLAAVALAAFSVVTAVIFHGAIGDQNQFIHLLKNLAIAGGLLQVAAFGAGGFSLDARYGAAAQVPARPLAR
jgi:putative oxidoreductase